MPPQKNSANRAKKTHRESGATVKSRREAETILKNIGDLDENKHICRVVKNFGNGRVEVFYVKQVKNRIEDFTGQATIRGSFRGKGKRDVWIDIGSFVVVEENLNILEVVAILSRQDMKEIVSLDNTYKKVLYGDTSEENEAGIEFDESSDNEDEDKPAGDGIISKKDKKKHNRQNIPVEQRSDSEVDIDDI